MQKPNASEKRLAPPQKFADKIANSIRQDIDKGVYKPGDRLPTESDLAVTFGVSRAVIREALTALRQDSIVESFQGKGIFVSTGRLGKPFRLPPLDLQDKTELRNVLEFMIANDVAAAGLAATRRTDKQLEEIKDALFAMARAIDRGDTGIEEDMNFHKAIAVATANPYFVSFHAFLENQVRHLMRETRLNSQRNNLSKLVQDEHYRIFEAIAEKNPVQASEASETHLRNAAIRLQEFHSAIKGTE